MPTSGLGVASFDADWVAEQYDRSVDRARREALAGITRRRARKVCR